MSQREANLQRIIKFLSQFKTEVELRNSINLYDINIHAEYFYRDLFNLVYDLGLKNLNAQTTNAAYIDLIDTEKKIAIQVTSQIDNKKIKGAIEGFFANSANQDFRLIVLFIAKEAKNYKTDFTVGGKYKFDTDKDIIDIKRLLADIGDKTADDIKKIADFLTKDDIKFPSIAKFIPSDFPTKTKYFTGRQNVLEEIDNVLQTKGNASLAETHGVGKTSILLEYAFRNSEKYSQVIFIRATNNEFDTQVSKVLDSLGFSLPNDAKPEQRLAVFQDWLAKNDNWLLLVDNVDDVAFIKECKFNKPNGKVFYTSNDSQIFKIANKIELPKMISENAMLLLYKHWQETEDAKFEDIPEKYREALKGIAEKFGNHPFSMAFVGSYLSAEDESLDEFLEAYQKKEKNLLAKYSFITDYQHKEVATAFLLRFEQISTPKDESKREQFLATAVQDYLKLSAFLATDNIPEELLQQSLALLHPDQTKWTEDKDFIKDIFKRFKPTSIFKRDAEDKTLSTHRIVQEIMRTQIEDEEDVILKCLAQVLVNKFEPFNFTNKEIVERYLSHVGVFLEYTEANKLPEQANLKLENKPTSLLCNRYARYFEQYGQYENAIKYYELFKDICESAQDIDQHTLATSYNNLGELYQIQGKYELAETYYLKAIKIREKTQGVNHPDIATNYNNLGLLYVSQGKYELAETYYLKALKIYEKELGENHPSTAGSYNNLSGLYSKIGNLKLAKEYQQKSLNSRLANFGENHPDVAQSYWWIGTFCQEENNYQEAIDYYYKAKEIYLKFLPKEHPSIQNLQVYINSCEQLIKESES